MTLFNFNPHSNKLSLNHNLNVYLNPHPYQTWFLNHKYTVVLGLLLCISIVFLYYSTNTNKKNSSVFSHQPPEYMKAFTALTFDASGKIENELEAQHWSYNAKTQQSVLQDLLFKPYLSDGSFWLISSQQGMIQQAHSNLIQCITLQKSVVLEKPSTDTESAILIKTDLLFYEPQTDHAYTSMPISLEKDNFYIQGHGLNAYLKQNSVELLKNVTSTYRHS